MITRAQIRRQLRKNGGIMNTVPRTGYFLGGIKDRIRKLIPNEIANVAVKAAPFVAPFNPGIAGLMRGIGRFDQRGSLSDALKQGLLTTAGGAGARYLGGQRGMGDIMGGGLRGGFTNPISSDSPLRNLFTSKDVKKVKPIDKSKEGIGIVRKGVEETIGKVPILKDLPPMVQQQLFVGGVTAGASALHSYFTENFREKLPEETMEQYLEARKKRVGIQMRSYMDNYFTFDPEYSALDEAGKDAFVARYNKKQGGRVGLANGSPHFDPPKFSEGVPQMFVSDTLGALPKAGGGVRSEDMGILSVDDFNNIEDYRRYIHKLAYERARKAEPDNPRLSENDIMRQLNKIVYEMARTKEPDSRLSEGDIMRMLDRITNKKAKGGRVNYKEGGGFEPLKYTSKIKEMWEMEGENDPLGTIIKIGLTVRAPIVDVVRMLGFTGATGASLVAEIAKRGYDVTKPIRDVAGGIAGATYDVGKDIVKGSKTDTRFIQPMYYLTRFGPEKNLSDEETQLEMMKHSVGRDDPKKRREITNRLFNYENINIDQDPESEYISGKIKFEEDYPSWAKGGRVSGYGGGITATMPRIPMGTPRVNAGGIRELDYRAEGGFVPVGVKEKADDVPAMLSKNEFVMTADAVKGAGGGSVEKGAQRMYNTMKKLEGRVA